MMRNTKSRLYSSRIAVCVIIIALILAANSATLISRADSHSAKSRSSNSSFMTAASQTMNCVIYQNEGGAACRNSTPEESLAIMRRDTTRELHTITPPSLQAASGLQRHLPNVRHRLISRVVDRAVPPLSSRHPGPAANPPGSGD